MFAAIVARMDGLRARYAEPHRAYHTEAHIEAMLAGMAALGSHIACPAAFELAVWYHDAVYDPAASDNEARSAALLGADMAGLVDPTLLRRADALVRGTADHLCPPGLPVEEAADMALFLDLDMAVLGADPPIYDAYERGIAAEYLPVVGAERFAAGRKRFLEEMLARPRLFHTEHFGRLNDAAARRNMRRATALM